LGKERRSRSCRGFSEAYSESGIWESTGNGKGLDGGEKGGKPFPREYPFKKLRQQRSLGGNPLQKTVLVPQGKQHDKEESKREEARGREGEKRENDRVKFGGGPLRGGE